MYFIIERQATAEIKAKNVDIIVPCFITTLMEDGREVIPVFLSRLHAHMYLASIKKLDEFQVVDINNMGLSGYISVYTELKSKTDEFFKYEFYIVTSLHKVKKSLGLAFLRKQYKGYELFCNTESVEKETLSLIPEELRKIIQRTNKLSDDKIIAQTQAYLASSKTISDKSQELFTKIKNKLFPKRYNPAEHDKGEDIEVGKMRVFMLIDKAGNTYSSMQEGKPVICFFVNKLDATITSLIEQQKDKKNIFRIFQVEEDNVYFKLLKKIYEKGKIEFAISYGFMCINDGVAPKWGSTIKDQSIPNMVVPCCEPQDIENGYDLTDYLCYMEGEKEREIALSGLINTNLATEENLTNIAKKTLLDMKANTVFVPKDKLDKIYPRLVFVGS